MLNLAQVIGRCGKDPEVRFSGNGNAVCNLSVATTEKWKDRDGNPQERTEWHRISCFGKTAENVGKYVSKGSLLYVSGRLQTRSYEKDGSTRYSTDIVADNIRFLSPKSEGNGGERRASSSGDDNRMGDGSSHPASGVADDSDDQIPF